jgi:hypothetical protein
MFEFAYTRCLGKRTTSDRSGAGVLTLERWSERPMACVADQPK